MQVSALATPRHRCSSCGACCQGNVILLLEGEAEVLVEQAALLGVDHPIEDGSIRTSQGECVFLGPDRLCLIHARFGGDKKPTVCQQFPFVITETEDGLRVGIDPASVAWHTSREQSPELSPANARPRRPTRLSPQQAAAEQHLVSLCGRPDLTLAGLIAVLGGGVPGGSDLPEGFAERWLEVVRAAPLAMLLGHKSVGPDHRRALLPVVDDLPKSPPSWPVLSPELDAESIALIRDCLYLRVISKIPLVQATALLMAGGAVLCAWHNPEPAIFRRNLSMWCHILRAGPFWQSLVPDPGRLQWLATGTSP